MCKHKWIPNGITTKELWWGEDDGVNAKSVKQGEAVFASCICEKCGEIRIKEAE